MKTERVPVADLVMDFDLYPRHDVDSTHVFHIREAMEAGVKMPPVIACSETKKIIDGFHRCTAATRLYGDKAEVEVEWKKYKNDAERFLDAMRYNSGHGRNMTPFDRTRCVLKAAVFKIEPAELASALCVTVEAVERLTIDRVGHLRSGTSPTGSQVPLKMPIRYMAGRQLTRGQMEANERLGGNRPIFWANQLILLMETNLIDHSDEKLMERLETLRNRLSEMLAVAAT